MTTPTPGAKDNDAEGHRPSVPPIDGTGERTAQNPLLSSTSSASSQNETDMEARIRARATARQKRLTGAAGQARLIMLERGFISPEESCLSGGADSPLGSQHTPSIPSHHDTLTSLGLGHDTPLRQGDPRDDDTFVFTDKAVTGLSGLARRQGRDGSDMPCTGTATATATAIGDHKNGTIRERRRKVGLSTEAEPCHTDTTTTRDDDSPPMPTASPSPSPSTTPMTSHEAKFIADLSSTVVIIQKIISCSRFLLCLIMAVVAAWSHNHLLSPQNPNDIISFVANLITTCCTLPSILTFQILIVIASLMLSEFVEYQRQRYQHPGRRADSSVSAFVSFFVSQICQRVSEASGVTRRSGIDGSTSTGTPKSGGGGLMTMVLTWVNLVMSTLITVKYIVMELSATVILFCLLWRG